MFAIGSDEIEKAPVLGKTILCDKCGKRHKVRHGKLVMPDGTEEESNLLSYHKCRGKAYLVGIQGKDIRK